MSEDATVVASEEGIIRVQEVGQGHPLPLAATRTLTTR